MPWLPSTGCGVSRMADAFIPINVWLDRPEQIVPGAYVAGYDDALRDVVRAISTKPKQIGGYAEPWIKLPDAIAAIDALREEEK